MTDIHVTKGFKDSERPQVADLFWQAFGAKLNKVLGPAPKARVFLVDMLNSDYALVARDDDGQLLGLVGFKTNDGGLVEGSIQDLARVYGWFGAIWRGLLLAALDRELKPGVLQMDGIFVDAQARGRGVGSALLAAIANDAVRRGCHCVELDVIDSNPRAKALYEREGFVPIKVEHTGPLRYVFGFASATKMRKAVSGAKQSL